MAMLVKVPSELAVNKKKPYLGYYETYYFNLLYFCFQAAASHLSCRNVVQIFLLQLLSLTIYSKSINGSFIS